MILCGRLLSKDRHARRATPASDRPITHQVVTFSALAASWSAVTATCAVSASRTARWRLWRSRVVTDGILPACDIAVLARNRRSALVSQAAQKEMFCAVQALLWPHRFKR